MAVQKNHSAHQRVLELRKTAQAAVAVADAEAKAAELKDLKAKLAELSADRDQLAELVNAAEADKQKALAEKKRSVTCCHCSSYSFANPKPSAPFLFPIEAQSNTFEFAIVQGGWLKANRPPRDGPSKSQSATPKWAEQGVGPKPTGCLEASQANYDTTQVLRAKSGFPSYAKLKDNVEPSEAMKGVWYVSLAKLLARHNCDTNLSKGHGYNIANGPSYMMESEEHILMSELNEKIFQIFSDFMTRVIKFEELVAVGSRLLVGFHQRLEFIRRPPINKTSELIERIFRANETRRVLTYVEAGCVNAHDSIQNISNSASLSAHCICIGFNCGGLRSIGELLRLKKQTLSPLLQEIVLALVLPDLHQIVFDEMPKIRKLLVTLKRGAGLDLPLCRCRKEGLLSISLQKSKLVRRRSCRKMGPGARSEIRDDGLSSGSRRKNGVSRSQAKCIVNELEGLVKEVTGAMRTANESKPLSQDKVTQDEFGPEATLYDKFPCVCLPSKDLGRGGIQEETVSSELPKPEHTDYAAMMSVIYSMVKLDYIMQEETVSSELPKPEHTDYAAMMSVIYSMVKLDYIMQQRIVSSLNLKSSSGELESYSLMWSLRPFINNDIMHQAWRLIP
ncbi:hypothetical protein TEA_025091 [Camellia sinensis var. sinensis]|uniref:DUF7795 domain-containing protein n=1 Tax=Camellia sinensis var. sinensis TaxID=542762 RepID=A0A4S4E1A7_CAMSN|nr:hypothetical protein TEA_025091 [Camellia sinensis var. sinensis]